MKRVSSPSTTAAATQPNMLREAALPAGYPAPGPVGVVLVKQYPASRVAVARQAGATQEDLFQPLFDHISKHNIPMSAPVRLTFSDSATTRPVEQSMAFFYGNPTVGTTGTDQTVTVVDEPAVTVVSVAVRGDYDAAHYQTGLAALQKWLASEPGRGYQIAGTPRYLAYNSPMVPSFVRYGEVQWPIVAR